MAPKLSARVRILDNERSDKTDAHDARSAAVVALRHSRLRVVRLEDHSAVLRLLAKRHHDLVAHRTRAICRLHTVSCQLVAGELPRNLSATTAAAELRRITATNAIGVERCRLARELLGEVRRAHAELIELEARITALVDAAATSVTEVFGVGPIMAALSSAPAATSPASRPPGTTPATTAQRPSKHPRDRTPDIDSTRAGTAS